MNVFVVFGIENPAGQYWCHKKYPRRVWGVKLAHAVLVAAVVLNEHVVVAVMVVVVVGIADAVAAIYADVFEKNVSGFDQDQS